MGTHKHYGQVSPADVPGTAPTGSVSMFAGASTPAGWLLCDGTEKAIATYPALYAALTASGTAFPYGGNTNGSGGAGSTHFRVPNLKGRVPVGRDAGQTEFDALGGTGGAKTHTLTIAEMPSHKHTENYKVNATGFGDQASALTNPTGSPSGAFDGLIGNTGGGGAHNNLQPYLVLTYIIKD